MQQTGARTQLLIVEETTRGDTPTTPSCTILPFTSEDLGVGIEAVISARIKGDRHTEGISQSNRDVGGSVSHDFDLESFGTLFRYGLGSNTTTGAGPYTHTMKGANALPSEGLSIEKAYLGLTVPKYVVFRGMLVNTLDLTFPNDGLITGSFGLIGMAHGTGTGTSSGTAGTTSIDSSPTDIAGTELSHFLGAVEIGGSPSIKVLSGTVNVNNNIDTDGYSYGNQDRLRMTPGMRNVTGNVSLAFEDTAEYDAFWNATDQALKFTVTSGTYSMEVYMPKVRFHGKVLPGISGPGPVTIDLDWTAKYDSTDTDIKITLINSQATI